MKRLILLLMIVLVVMLFSACSKDDEDISFELLTPRTDTLTLDLDYQGKSYLIDGIGEAVLATCEDGDTAEFIVDNEQIRVRFLGIDTPEASHFYEPWGYQATQFVCDKLVAAETIVLERNFEGILRDTYGRYLAFIWYDGRLINLEVIEKAYSEAVGAINLKYGTEMVNAWFELQHSGRRIYGETDTLFDYSENGFVTSIESIVQHADEYNFKKVIVEGVVTRLVGMHAYIERDGYGIYLYIGHTPSAALVVGNYIRLSNVRVIYDLERRGGVHLTDFPRASVTVLNGVTPLDIDIKDLTAQHVGRLVSLTNLTIESIEKHIDGSFSLYVIDSQGERITVHHPREIVPSVAVDPDTLDIGNVINVIGPIRDHLEGLQLLLTRFDDLIVTD